MKTAVLAGGISSERNVSLRSGKNVALALIRQGHSVALIDPSRYVSLSENLFTRDPNEIHKKFKLLSSSEPDGKCELDMSVLFILKRCDRAFLALHGGAGEDGRLQAALELFGIAYNGSPPTGCAVSMDKILAKRLLAESGILTPPYTLNRIGQKTVPPPSYPCVVKPSNGGSSIGVTFVSNPAEYEHAVENAKKYCEYVLCESVIHGRELTVGVLNNEPLAVTEIIPQSGFYDFENKYIPGKTLEVTPADLPEDLTNRAMSLAKRVHDSLGLKNFSRTDMILESSSGLLYVLEANTLPGMTETSLLPQGAKSIGISFDELCERMI